MTIPNNTFIAIGTQFTKVWRILNTGTDAWVDCTLVDVTTVEDENLGPTSLSFPIPYCLGGCWCDVSVEFVVPVNASTGPARSTWHLHSAPGKRFDFRDNLRDLFMIVEVVPE